MVIQPNGSIYEGDWLNNKQHGHGKKTYKDGNVYEGDWKKGKRHGKGKLIDFTGKLIHDGIWINDKFIVQ